MAQFKTCPSCGAEVPSSAARCKDCFHDFTAQQGRNWGPIMLLGTIAGMTLIAAVAFFIVALGPTDQLILVDEETKSVVITTQYRQGPSTERIPFSDIVKLEHVSEGGTYSIVAITTDADRKVIMQGTKEPLYLEAERYAKVMEKPLERVGETEVLKANAPPQH